MNTLTEYGTSVQDDLSQRYGLSKDAVRAMMDAVSRGGGLQAQFSVPELGGMGQWSSGGMTMVGDMFNTGLQNTVNNLCSEISAAHSRGAFYPPPPKPAKGNWQGQFQGGPSAQFSGGSFGNWWPEELGQPTSSGAQNNLSYAIFPQSRRLAINLGGQVTVYDTGEHVIGGISQQQSGDASWTFTSQFGTVYLSQLPVVVADREDPEPAKATPEPSAKVEPVPTPAPEPAPAPAPEAKPVQSAQSEDDIFATLEKLGSLRDKGVLTDEEFNAKKAELLARI